MTLVSVILDIVLLGTMILCVVLGIKRGFVKSVVRMIGSLAAFIVTALISGPIAQWLFDTLFRSSVHASVSGAIGAEATASVSSLQGQWGSVFHGLPDLLRNGLFASGVSSPDKLGEAVTQHGAATAGDAANVMVDNLIAPVCVMLLQILIFLVLFILTAIVIRLLAKVLDKIFSSLPIIRQLNTGLGAVAGLLHGAIITLVLCALLQMYMSMAGQSSVITSADLDATWWTRWVMDINPLF